MNFSKLDLPEITLSKAKQTHLLTHLLLYRGVVLSKYAEEHEIKISEIKVFVQHLIQLLVIRGYYRKDKFNVSAVFKHPEIKPGRLSVVRKNILGLLVYNKKVKLSSLSKIVEISAEKMEENLKFLIGKGLFIGRIKNKEIIPDWIWKPPEKAAITKEDTFIVGICMMLRNAEISKVTKHTNFSKEEVIERIARLMLYRKLDGNFDIETQLIGFPKVVVTVNKYHISPRILPLEALQGKEKEAVGYVILKKKTSIQDLAKFMDMESLEVRKVLALLTARGTFQFIFTETNYITPVVIPDLRPKRTIEEMATLSFFNYEALFGLISTQDKIQLKKLMSLMNRSAGEILEGVITLLLEGFISCTLKGNTLYIDVIRRYSRAQEGTLERWEKIVLGMVVAKSSINVKDIALALGVDKYYAMEKLYAFYGKGLIKGNISGNKLEPDEIPIFPPLVQLDDLPIHYQEIFGYIISNKRVTLNNLQKLWSKSAVAVKNIIFEITGSGLLNIKLSGSSFNIISFQKFLPTRELEDLGEQYVQIVNEIEKTRKKRVRMSTIATKASLAERDVFRIITQLAAHGYYRGIITSTYFEKSGQLILPSRKMHCLSCGNLIKSAYEPCSNCNQIPQRCIVCQGLIKHGDSVLECPQCSNLAHTDHMIQWLKIKEECPICKSKVTMQTLKTYAT